MRTSFQLCLACVLIEGIIPFEGLMKIRASSCHLLVVLTILKTVCLYAQTTAPSIRKNAFSTAMDRDRLEVTIPQLELLYPSHKYTVAEVVRWYIARVEKYSGISAQMADESVRHRHFRCVHMQYCDWSTLA